MSDDSEIAIETQVGYLEACLDAIDPMYRIMVQQSMNLSWYIIVSFIVGTILIIVVVVLSARIASIQNLDIKNLIGEPVKWLGIVGLVVFALGFVANMTFPGVEIATSRPDYTKFCIDGGKEFASQQLVQLDLLNKRIDANFKSLEELKKRQSGNGTAAPALESLFGVGFSIFYRSQHEAIAEGLQDKFERLGATVETRPDEFAHLKAQFDDKTFRLVRTVAMSDSDTKYFKTVTREIEKIAKAEGWKVEITRLESMINRPFHIQVW